MKRSRFSETELVYAVKQVEAGVPAAEVARKYGVSLKTIYAWRTKYGGLSASQGGGPPQATRGREPQTQTDGGGVEPGQAQLQEVLRKRG